MPLEQKNSPPSDDAGWIRLAQGLKELGLKRPKKALQKRLVKKIESEPPRVETDREGRVVAINPAFVELCGYSFSEVKGKKPGGMLQGPASEKESIQALREAIRSGTACEVEITNYHKDTSPYRVRISLQPVADATGQVTGFRAVEVKLPS